MNHERDVRFRGNQEQDQNGNGSDSTGNQNVIMEDQQEKKARRKRFISESAYQKYGSKSSRCKFTEVVVCENLPAKTLQKKQADGQVVYFRALNIDRFL
jgi:hypothetical protein